MKAMDQQTPLRQLTLGMALANYVPHLSRQNTAKDVA